MLLWIHCDELFVTLELNSDIILPQRPLNLVFEKLKLNNLHIMYLSYGIRGLCEDKLSIRASRCSKNINLQLLGDKFIQIGKAVEAGKCSTERG